MLPYVKATPQTKHDFENNPSKMAGPPPLLVKNDQPLTLFSKKPPFPQMCLK